MGGAGSWDWDTCQPWYLGVFYKRETVKTRRKPTNAITRVSRSRVKTFMGCELLFLNECFHFNISVGGRAPSAILHHLFSVGRGRGCGGACRLYTFSTWYMSIKGLAWVCGPRTLTNVACNEKEIHHRAHCIVT